MGSHYDRWMQCYWCDREGQCSTDTIAPLLDIDSWGGIFCIPCYERGFPPHYKYLESLLDVDWGVAYIIADFAYPAIVGCVWL